MAIIAPWREWDIESRDEEIDYAEGINPVRIYVEDEYIRAAPGLTGCTKCGGNYAASIKAGELAEEKGFSQVLWLDGVETKYVEEVGSMNIMFKIDGKIYTAACTGTVLPVSYTHLDVYKRQHHPRLCC